jgi:uridine phosphorylase
MVLKSGIWIERDASVGVILEKNWVIDEAVGFLKTLPQTKNLSSDVNYLWGQKIIYGDYYGVSFVALCAQGTPCATNAVERLYRTGVKRLVSVGTSGSTDESIPRGSFVITDASVRDEKTSLDYVDLNIPVLADTKLTRALYEELSKRDVELFRGSTFTTDLRYKENADLLRVLFRKANVLNIDMETSAILAVSQQLGLRAAALNVVTDCATAHTDGVFKGIFDGSQDYYSFVAPKLMLGLSASLDALVSDI